jgi:hypothetical protein
VIFEEQFTALHSNSFQEYFQRLMQYRYSSFLPVVTYGALGDQGSDGLSANGDKLYACYGPESPNDGATTRKFRADLASALKSRPDEFSTFVFVHNDRRGMHPRIATELVSAKKTHPSLGFEQMGKLSFWREFMRLDFDEAEDMLGQPIRVEELVYDLSLADLEPLLSHLGRTRNKRPEARIVPMHKLEFNGLSADIRDYMVHGMRFAKQLDEYYEGYYDVEAREETAAAFKERYMSLHGLELTPDEIFQDLFVYVIGNMLPNAELLTSAHTILSYFLQRCDIFEEPPDEYRYSPGGAN